MSSENNCKNCQSFSATESNKSTASRHVVPQEVRIIDLPLANVVPLPKWNRLDSYKHENK